MKLLESGIKGFGKLVNRKFNFGKNFTLIYGKNEAGKTTLWKFLLYCLFGYDKSEVHDYKPWSSQEYGGYCIYELEDSHRYRISRDFGRNEYSFYDLSKEIDMSNDVSIKQGNGILVDQLGIDLKMFETFTTIAEIQPEIEEKSKVSVKLGELVEREEEIGKLKKAIEQVESRLKDIGADGSADSPMGNLKIKIRELKSRLESLKEKDYQKRKLIEQIYKLNKKINDIDEKIKTLRLDLKALYVQEHREKLAEIEDKRNRLEEIRVKLSELSKYKDIRTDKRDEMMIMVTKIKEIEKSISSEEDYLKRQRLAAITIENEMNEIEKALSMSGEMNFETVSLKIQNIQLRYDMLEEKKKHLESMKNEFADFVEDTRDKIEKLKAYESIFVDKNINVSELEELKKQAGIVVDTSEKAELDDQKRQLRKYQKNMRSLIWWIIGGILVGIVGITFGYLGNPYIYFIGGAGILLFLFSLIERVKAGKNVEDSRKIIELLEKIVTGNEGKKEEAKRKLVAQLSEGGFASVEEAKIAYEDYLRLKKRDYERETSKYKVQIEDAERMISSYSEELMKMVEAFVSPAEKNDLGKHVKALIDQVQRYRKLLLEKARTEDSIERTQERLRQYQNDKENADLTLKKLYEKVKVHSIEEYDELLARKDKYISLRFLEKELTDALAEIDSKEEKKMIKEVEENSALLNRIVDSSSANIQIDLKKYEIEKEKVIDEMKKQQAALDSKMEEETIGNVKMELMSEEKKLSDMISYSNSLLHVRRFMRELYENVKNDFVPKLRKELKKSIQTITKGKYEDVEVGKDLSVTLMAKDKKIRSIAMSKGTREQIKFAIMLSFGKIFSRNSEPLPLLLDDPFVNYDDERYRIALDLLRDISKENQIVLFTCRSDTKEFLSPYKDVLMLELK